MKRPVLLLLINVQEFQWLGWPCLYLRIVPKSGSVTVNFKISDSALNAVSYIHLSWFKERKIFHRTLRY
jgi:hypothetical protein